MSTVNGFQVGSETLKYNYESLENYNTPEFSTSSSKIYTVGDYVMHNGKLYKCTIATTGGTWNVNNWEEAILSDDVASVKNAIIELQSDFDANEIKVNDLVKRNSTNVLLDFGNFNNNSSGNLGWTWNESHTTCTYSYTGQSPYIVPRIYNGSTSLPDVLTPGETYQFKFSATRGDLHIKVMYYANGTVIGNQAVYGDRAITIPDTCDGLVIEVGTPPWAFQGSITVALVNAPSNAELAESLAAWIGDVGALENAVNDLNDNKAPVIINTTSGDIATFADGADGMQIRKIIGTIVSQQDLHGYDHPWPSGGGKNLLPMTVDGIKAVNAGTWTENTIVLSDITFTILTDSDGNVTGVNCDGTASSTTVLWLGSIQLSNGDSVKVVANTQTDSDVFFRISGPGKAVYDINVSSGTYTATSDVEIWGNIRIGSGSTVSNKVFYPVVCKSTETDTAFEPYENICPITGHTGMTGKRTGKNLYDISLAANDQTGNTLTRTGNELVWTANNRTWAGYSMMPRDKRIRLNAGVTYTVSAYCTVLVRDANYTPKLCLRNNDAAIIASANLPSTDNTEQRISFQYTPSEDIVVYMSAVITGATAGNASVRIREPMVEIGSVVTNYEPYAEQDISVNWQDTAGTVYGGTLDVISGRMVVNKGRMVVDGNRILYNIAARTNTVRFAVSASPTMSRVVRAAIPVISDVLPTSTSFDFYNSDKLGVCGWTSAENENPGLWMSIPIEAGSTEESVKAWLNANPITCVYPIAAPTEYQLTPQEVTTLLGHNVVQMDVGQVSVTAPRDTKMYVDNKIAEAVAAGLNT